MAMLFNLTQLILKQNHKRLYKQTKILKTEVDFYFGFLLPWKKMNCDKQLWD